MFGDRNESLIIAIGGSGGRTVQQSPYLELPQLAISKIAPQFNISLSHNFSVHNLVILQLQLLV